MISFRSFLINEMSKYHAYYPKFKNNEVTLDKIIKRIRGVSSIVANSSLSELSTYGWKAIREYDSPEDLQEHVYWHGTGGGISGGLKAGFTQVRNGSGGGGGYGELYHSISVSKNKNKASNFTANSSYGSVYPVLLRKGASVKEMPEVSDALELEDHLIQFWKDGVDAVKIGKWDSEYSEEELVVLNPKAIILFTKSESYPVYQKKKFENPSIEVYRKIYNAAKTNPQPSKNETIKIEV